MNVKELNFESGVNPNEARDLIALGAGCFWCIEAVFQRLSGVLSVESGYSNGNFKNPCYREVCMGNTGHVEVALIEYNPQIVSLAEILEVFWLTHDPTTLNKQGYDKGTQYRSGIYYQNQYQKQIAEKSKLIANESGLWDLPIVTEIVELRDYSKAEEDHQNFYNQNSQQPYCTFVVKPKVDKLHQLFKEKMKREYVNG